MFQGVLKPFNLQLLKQILKKRIIWKKILPNIMISRKYFSSKSGVKFIFISKLVLNFNVDRASVYFLHFFFFFF